MTENPTPNEFTPRDALAALEEARAYEEPLRQRTEGLTWMIWGLVTPAIFLTYAFTGVTGVADAWWVAILWAPWVVAGVAITGMLWSTAALASPVLRESEATATWVLVVAWATVIGGVGALASSSLVRVNDVALWVLGIGTAWALLFALRAYKASPWGRRVGTVIGAAYFLVGAALALTAGTTAPDHAWASLVAMVAGGAIPMAGGAYQVLRG